MTVEPIEPLPTTEEDFYFEGPYCVFTAAYHLKRGFCCENVCRHCPYRDEEGNILPEAPRGPTQVTEIAEVPVTAPRAAGPSGRTHL